MKASSISLYTGSQIKMYRRLQGLTIQDLADRIHKSRATVSKYENGSIILDIETLNEISKALNVEISQLISDPENKNVNNIKENRDFSNNSISNSSFYKSTRLYLYYYDGRYKRLKDGVIDVFKDEIKKGGCRASLTISAITDNGKSGETYYSGRVVYSDMLIRFSFLNLYNKLEEDLLYIFNPLECRDFTEGLLCGISSADLSPCTFKCIVSLEPINHYEELKESLMIGDDELKRWKRLNMMIVDNRPNI